MRKMLRIDLAKGHCEPLVSSFNDNGHGYGTSLDEDNIKIKSRGTPKMRESNSSQNEEIMNSSFVKKILSAPFADHAAATKYVTVALCGLLAWALLWVILGKEVEFDGQLFALIMLEISCYFCGWLISFLQLPPLLGMLLCGIALRNLGLFNMTGVYVEVVRVLRQLALTTILLKGGLDLDPEALKKLSFVVVKLAFLPCITETIAAAVAAYYLLNMPWLWGLLLGSCLSAVSPAVVVPSLLRLKMKGYGENKGIATLVIAASSLDDIISISIFGVLLGLIFAQGDLMGNILHVPIEIAGGVIIGIAWGLLASIFPHQNEKHVIFKRSFMVGGGGLAAVLLSEHFGYSGCGPLAGIIISFIASMCWKWQGWTNSYNPVTDVLYVIWEIMEPLLFGLIGTEIRFDEIELFSLWIGCGVLFFGLLIRVATCSVALIGAKLNFKEIIFVNLAWLPKATVQATLGPLALDTVTRTGMINFEVYARKILTIAVASILITAPIGAVSISLCGTKFLSNDGFVEPPKKNNKKQDIATVENQL